MSSWDKQTAPVTNKLFLKLLQVEEQMGLCSPHKHAAAGGLVAEFCPTLMIPWTVARQAPLSRGFYRGEYWSGLPFPPPEEMLSPFSCVQRFATLWIVAHQASLSMGFSMNTGGKNTGVGCHAFLQRIFLTQGWNPDLLYLLHWQLCSLLLVPPGKPKSWIQKARTHQLILLSDIQMFLLFTFISTEFHLVDLKT